MRVIAVARLGPGSSVRVSCVIVRIGKRAAGIQVLRADGLPVGWRESSLRNLLLVADFLPMAYTTGLLCMLCDGRFRRLGDIVADINLDSLESAPQR